MSKEHLRNLQNIDPFEGAQQEKFVMKMFQDYQLTLIIRMKIRILFTFFHKKPLYKQPSTRQPKSLENSRTTKERAKNFRSIAHLNRYLVQRKAVPNQCVYDIALEFNSY